MYFRVIAWLLVSGVGVVLLALPDRGPRIVGFSGAHGLTLLDAAGVSVLLAAWLPVAVAGWQRRRELANRSGSRFALAALFLSGLGCGLLLASVFW